MKLYTAIGAAVIGVLCMLYYFSGDGRSVVLLILGVLNLILGSMNVKKYREK